MRSEERRAEGGLRTRRSLWGFGRVGHTYLLFDCVSGDAWSRPPSWTADVGVLVCGVRVLMSVVRVKHGFMH